MFVTIIINKLQTGNTPWLQRQCCQSRQTTSQFFFSMSLNGDPLNDTTLNDVKILLNTYTVSFDFNLWVIPRFSANVCEKKKKSIPNYFLLSKPWLFYRTLEKQRVRHVSTLTLTSGDQQKFTYLWIRYAHHTSASHMRRHVYYLRAANITRHDALVLKSKLKTHTKQSFYTLRTPRVPWANCW